MRFSRRLLAGYVPLIVGFVSFNTSTTYCLAFQVLPLPLATKQCCSSSGGFHDRNAVLQQKPAAAVTFATISSSKWSDRKTKDGDVDSSDPSNWCSDTKPYTIVRHFAGPDVTDADIQQMFEVHSIRTLGELIEKGEVLQPLLKNGVFFYFGAAIIAALDRTRKTAEEVLGEAKIVYDASCIPKNAYELYAPGAVSVYPPVMELTSDDRYPVISMVMGSSGSGKTLFAIRRIPQMLWNGDESSYFRIHFRASQVLRVMSKYGVLNPGQTLSFEKAVAAIVNDVILEKLSGKGLDGVKTLNIPIHITIDEAGGDLYKNYFDTADKIISIVEAVKNDRTFDFQKDVHVTVTGTRLETTTGDIASTRDNPKFRMQPWTADNFDSFVDTSSHPQKARVKQVVHGFPILEDLTSNARCAFYLLRSLGATDVLLLRENRLRSSVAVLVSSVADKYIASNGLGDLTSAEQKWKVVRSAFREVDRSSRNKGFAFFPQFADLEMESTRSIASSLLDINVDSKEGVITLASDFKFAVSMTPALAIVVANLLSTDAKISWDWEGLETSVMLSELKRLVVNSQDVPQDLDRLVLQLPSPLPAPSANKTFSVPVVNNHTVVLNGPKAKYADVIAPYRLIQTKFSRDNTKALVLDLQNELDKMGVTHSKNHSMQQWITTVFRIFWDQGNESASWTEAKPLLNVVNKEDRQEYYPFNTLNSKILFQTPKVVRGILRDDNWCIEWSPTGKPFDWIAAFHERCPVTAVFATNCKAFKFKVKRERKEGGTVVEYEEDIVVSQENVDWEGIWKQDGDEFAKLGLRDGVEIRFFFC